MTREELENILGYIECEGFDYYFTSYSSPESFKDLKFRELIVKYREAKEETESYLREEAERMDVNIDF